MTEAHYRTLKQPFVENDDKKHSAMLHWLNLLVNSANPSQGDVCEIDGRCKYTFLDLFWFYNVWIKSYSVFRSFGIRAPRT